MSIIKKMRAFLLAISFKYYKLKGGYRDSNPGPPEPQSGALTNCAIPTIITTYSLFHYLILVKRAWRDSNPRPTA